MAVNENDNPRGVVLFVEKDPEGRSVECRQRDWDHICARHPYLRGLQASIRKTISDPLAILTDADRPADRIVYYRLRRNSSFLKVVVDKAAFADDAAIVTAYYADSIKSEEIVLWMKKR